MDSLSFHRIVRYWHHHRIDSTDYGIHSYATRPAAPTVCIVGRLSYIRHRTDMIIHQASPSHV